MSPKPWVPVSVSGADPGFLKRGGGSLEKGGGSRRGANLGRNVKNHGPKRGSGPPGSPHMIYFHEGGEG